MESIKKTLFFISYSLSIVFLPNSGTRTNMTMDLQGMNHDHNKKEKDWFANSIKGGI